MKFTYMKTPLKKYTFENRRIREWVERHVEGQVLNLFAGMTLLNCKETRNDLREEMPADFHMDALEFVKHWQSRLSFVPEICLFDTVILDPPYAYRKSMEMYGGAISSPFNQIKNELPSIMNPESIVITFGYHSNVMGEKRGFEQEHILLMSHGGAIHDTIAVIERKSRDRIDDYFDRG